MAERSTFQTGIAWALGVGAAVFVLLLGGFASGALTDDPPAVSPYASGSSDSGDVFETDAYDLGGDATATTAGDGGSAGGPGQITIAGFDFGAPIEVTVGQNIVITNEDGASHTWTDAAGGFDSGRLGGGESFEFAFDAAGTYEFFCAIHPSMEGSITVTNG